MCVYPRLSREAMAAVMLSTMILSSFTPLMSEPAHPAWWNDRNVKNTNPAQNRGVANIGQLKHIATQAHAELESLLPGGAGYALPFDPPPANPYATWYESQKKALNLGQLKAVAKPLYDRLNAVSPDWVKEQLDTNGLNILGTDYFLDTNGGYYPWNPSTPVAENYKVATVGQLKLVFCLRFGENLDGDEVSDLFEWAAIGSTALALTTAQETVLRQSEATASSDSDGDGLTNAEEAALGSDVTNTDTDGDLLDDGEDADPADKAVNWKGVANSSYAVIELDTPAGISSADGWGFVLGDGGHVVMSKEQEWGGGSGAPGTDHYKTYVWDPATTSWSGLLALPANLRGVGSHVDKDGNIYGKGYGALGYLESGPGKKEVLMKWGKSANGWSTAQALSAQGLGNGFSDEIDTWTHIPPVFDVPLDLFGDSGFFRSQSTHGAANGSTSAYRDGTNDNSAFLTASINQNQDEQITLYKQAGEPRGWHAATWTKTESQQSGGGNPTVTQDYVFARLLPDQSLQAASPPAGDARWKLSSLASIEDGLKPDGVNEIVVWQMTDGKFQTGSGTAAALAWQETTKAIATQRLAGKVNARGEGLQGAQLWRNGLWHDLDDLVGHSEWSNVQGIDINRYGLIVAMADKGEATGGEDKVVLLIPAGIVPDYNRDGKIDQKDRGKITETNPWRFWDNDDNDHTVEERRVNGDDTPGQSIADQDGNDLRVDGVRDLIDFFPLYLDLKQALEILPTADYKYVLKHETEAIKFFEFPAVLLDGSDPENAPHSHMRDISLARIFKEKDLKLASIQGAELSAVMLEAFKDGEGIILCEAVRNRTEQPLILEIIKRSDNISAAEIEFALSISPIEDMYRTKYFDPNDSEGGNGGGYAMPSDPSNWPDEDRNGKHFVLVHGYNVNRVQSHGWFSEFFKRLFWSGSNAKFTGISWEGYESQTAGNTPDYWRNVTNAFQTSKDVANFVNLLGGQKSIAAHSLGNMVVGSAMKDHGLLVENYFMIDAAVAIEAYEYTFTDSMRPSSWSGYDSKLWPTHWHELFLPSDGSPPVDERAKLTWRMRFDAFPNAYNCYSWGEEVLRDGQGTVPGITQPIMNGGLRSWVYQEMTKGGSLLSGGGLGHDGQGGWAFNFNNQTGGPYSNLNTNTNQYVMYPPADANAISDEDLKVSLFFKRFNNDDINHPNLGSAAVANYDTLSGLLAEAIPAYSFAAGSNEMLDFQDRNISMMSFRTNENEWPLDGVTAATRNWLHSDIRDVGYLHNYKLFDEFVEISSLK